MECSRLAAPLLALSIPAGLLAQDGADPEGFEWGPLYVKPEARALEAYDNRAQFDRATGNATSDFYTELAAGVSLNNLPARYDLFAKLRYGYRFYSDNTDLNDDFYTVGAGAGSAQNPLKWGLFADMTKSLNYNTAYNPATGDGPDSILADTPNRRSVVRGNLAYEKQLTEKTSITPGYDIQHYYQEFFGGGTAEWQTHSLGIQLQKEYSAKTHVFLEGGCSFQVNDDENGYVGTVEAGAAGHVSDKTSWKASVGFAAANYDFSGSDQAGVFSLRLLWQVTEKVSAYVFGGNDYQPGYDGGGARMVYRAGYGVDWRPTTRWMLGGSALHDYQDGLGDVAASPGTGETRHFFSAQCGYNLTTKMLFSLSGSYVNDELEADQAVLALGLSYRH